MPTTTLVFLFLHGASPFTAVTPPSDDDADTTVTTFTDFAGYVVRPARITIRHAMDSAREADLTGGDRTPLDRFEVRSLRSGRLPNEGLVARVIAHSARAGDAFAPLAFIFDLGVSQHRRRLSTDTANRTDRDGYTVVVPSLTVFHAADSALRSTLTALPSDRDRFYTRHDVPASGRIGGVHRVLVVSDGRAGSAFAPSAIILDVSVTRAKRVAARST